MASEAQILKARIAELEAKLASKGSREVVAEFRSPSKKYSGKIDGKLSEYAGKGNIVIKGLTAQFPISLYVGQLVRLVRALPSIVDTAAAHIEEASYKDGGLTQAQCSEAIESFGPALDLLAKLTA